MRGIDVANLIFASDNVVSASCRFIADEEILILRHTNKVIIAYVTAGARFHLYLYRVTLQENTIYCDLDSVIFIQPRDKTKVIQTGGKVGDMIPN